MRLVLRGCLALSTVFSFTFCQVKYLYSLVIILGDYIQHANIEVNINSVAS